MIVEAHGWFAVFAEDQNNGILMHRVALWQERESGKIVGLVEWQGGAGLTVAEDRLEFMSYIRDVDINERTTKILVRQANRGDYASLGRQAENHGLAPSQHHGENLPQ